MIFDGYQQIDVPAITVNELLRRHLRESRGIDFLSLDVEGSEIDVLRGMDLNLHRPRVLCVEANDQNAEIELKTFMERYGYRGCRSLGPNRFFVREEADAERLRSVRMDCQIEKNLHPLGAEYTLASARRTRRIGNLESKAQVPWAGLLRPRLRRS
jgi:hypothetical protein